MSTTRRRKHSPAMARVTSLALILLPLITFGVLLWLLHDATQTLNTAWEQSQ